MLSKIQKEINYYNNNLPFVKIYAPFVILSTCYLFVNNILNFIDYHNEIKENVTNNKESQSISLNFKSITYNIAKNILKSSIISLIWPIQIIMPYNNLLNLLIYHPFEIYTDEYIVKKIQQKKSFNINGLIYLF